MTEVIQLDITGVMYTFEAVKQHSYRCVEPRAEYSALRTTRERGNLKPEKLYNLSNTVRAT